MQDLGLKSYDKLYPMMIRKYSDLIVDQNASETDKINQIITQLNALGKLSNDVVRNWNTVYQWTMNDGLSTDVSNKVEEMKANGELDTVLQSVFASLAGDLSALHTTAKDNLVNSINEVDDLAKSNAASLAESSSQLNDIFINVKHPPVPMVGAKGDGTDDTTPINNIYNSLGSRGGTLFFPSGDYKFNLVITKSNIVIVGSGRSSQVNHGGNAGTRFLPNDLTKPALQIGDGTSDVNTITFHGFTVCGEQNTNTSDGIVINGAYQINGWDYDVLNFGRDNIRIQSSATMPSYYINLSNFDSLYSRGSAFKTVYGPQYVTAINLSNFNLSGYSNAGSTAIYNDSCRLNLSNGWIQAHNGVGHVYMTGTGMILYCSTVVLDSDSSTDVLVEVNKAPALLGSYLSGDITVDGLVKWNDGSSSPSAYSGSYFLPYHARINYAHVTNALLFGQQDGTGATPEVVNDSGPRIYRKGANPSEVLILQSMALRPLMSYQYPLQIGANGSIWRNATTSQLRYRKDQWFPSSDVDGVPLTTYQAVPTTATSAGNTGDIASDGAYLYICTAANTWKRVAIATW